MIRLSGNLKFSSHRFRPTGIVEGRGFTGLEEEKVTGETNFIVMRDKSTNLTFGKRL